ncbi:MAG: hypothetical protein O7D91_01900 [Planctomycetota bacterium]|nr:hypothetical protein [Planctomycetota bacterium]
MQHLMPLLATAALVLSTAAAYADLGDQLFKLLPDDGAGNDQFGHSVAISGTTAIVGALWDNDNKTGLDSGSAYLFNITTGQQLFKLLPDDGAADDRFGRSVAINGTIAIVGVIHDDDNGSNSGSSYLFDSATGEQIVKILPDDGAAGDRFGISVAISGTTAIVGASFDDDNGDLSGSAYIFGISDPVNPTQIARLLPDDGAEVDAFGGSVAISGTTVIGGARGDDDACPENPFCYTGSAYLFDAASAPACPADFDGDGAVGPFDLALLLGNWGPCADPDNCPADLDGNGEVGPFDLALVLGNWGPCP